MLAAAEKVSVVFVALGKYSIIQNMFILKGALQIALIKITDFVKDQSSSVALKESCGV